jgi:hypothetical protein
MNLLGVNYTGKREGPLDFPLYTRTCHPFALLSMVSDRGLQGRVAKQMDGCEEGAGWLSRGMSG